ncbi:hypothetical protein [Aurantiacibacter zhengii]|uniref:Uncharacterized protein n=1 Tax=Aurantiacibacter zhengii TaxID=2307003 RepID=A0A418NUC7_9SPHN|nr:hypothetical protein [Aurantiacibacter zhengii]RIV87611.1 hypothetical protein D2V07_04510 [Aurantiacibacter zhengii]
MNAVEIILMLAFLGPLLFAISWVREALRQVEPNIRLAIGIAALIAAVVTFFAMMKILPEPAAIQSDLFLLTVLMGGMSAFAGGIVLSGALIGSAVWQSYKRWKFHRSNGS